MFLLVFGFFRKAIEQKPRVGLFVDGPNMIRKEFNLDLKSLRVVVEKYGRITIGKIFLSCKKMGPREYCENFNAHASLGAGWKSRD